MAGSDYAHPEVLVQTDWVSQHTTDRNVVIVEVDQDTKAYDEGHIPGAIAWNWRTQLCDPLQRDIVSKLDMEKLLGSSGIAQDTTVVLYGTNDYSFAAWAFWVLKLYGHIDVRMINGGRKKWIAEGRELTREVPLRAPVVHRIRSFHAELRAYLRMVQDSMDSATSLLVDVRSPAEYSGKAVDRLGLSEMVQRGGHIPGAKNIPWWQAINENGEFKHFEDLVALYCSNEIPPAKNILVYCQTGERSSLSWFVLKYLLGCPHVFNYDGSWSEWGNLVGAPIEKGL